MNHKIIFLLLSLIFLMLIMGCVQKEKTAESSLKTIEIEDQCNLANASLDPKCHNQISLPKPVISRAETIPYNKDEIALHNIPEDCWVIVGDVVYDISRWVIDNPKYSKYCGNESSELVKKRKDTWIQVGILN